jgi:hypothetical protein
MRNLKVFGAVVVAMLALSAVVASAAFASYNSESESTSLTGKSTSSQVFKTKFGTIECSAGEFTGSQTGKTASSVRVHPSYTGCKALGFNATVTTTGCDYIFGSTSEVAGTGFGAAAEVTCETGKKIHIVAAGGLCSVDVGAQANVGNVDFMNESGAVGVASTANAIAYEGVGGFCSGAGTGGSYEGSVKVTGTSEGSPTGISVS